MDFSLTQEQEMIVTTVRSFVEHEIYPHEATVERTGVVPEAIGKRTKPPAASWYKGIVCPGTQLEMVLEYQLARTW